MIEKLNDKISSDKSSEAILDNIIAKLHQESRHLRVWSIVMSIYGDAVMPYGGAISLKGLSLILTRMNIGTGALRTAMSRLARDGWMERFRARNTSFYRISNHMQQDIQQASLQIYAYPDDDYIWQGHWQLAIPQRQALTPKILEDMQVMGFIPLNALLYIRFVTADEKLPNHADIIFMQAQGKDFKGKDFKGKDFKGKDFKGKDFKGKDSKGKDSKGQDYNPQLIEMVEKNHKGSKLYQILSAEFLALADNLDGGGALVGLDALVARILLIHYWRRAVLADNSTHIANPFRHNAHLLTKKIYHHLQDESETWLKNSACIDKSLLQKNIINQRFK
ncbi:MAG: hypothetical protein K0U39_05090 [Alphaproteobacteria bacterium]|nr:hypothetical protein [Alphaproteobacteria bacterium]